MLYASHNASRQAVLPHLPLVWSHALRAENRQAHSDSASCSAAGVMLSYFFFSKEGRSTTRRIGFLAVPWITPSRYSYRNNIWQNHSEVCLFIYYRSNCDLNVPLFLRRIDIVSHHLPRRAVLRICRTTHQASNKPTINKSDIKPLVSHETPQAIFAEPISPIAAFNGE
jgi:hypothetical protein